MTLSDKSESFTCGCEKTHPTWEEASACATRADTGASAEHRQTVHMPDDTSAPVSRCCGASVYPAMAPLPFHERGSGTVTGWYVCTDCRQECAIVQPTRPDA